MLEPALIDKIRGSLRVSLKNEMIEQEIKDIIAACKKDLKLVGVNNVDEKDPLIIRAITLYAKSEFGSSDKAEKFKESYEMLKNSLRLAGDYNTVHEEVKRCTQK